MVSSNSVSPGNDKGSQTAVECSVGRNRTSFGTCQAGYRDESTSVYLKKLLQKYKEA